jgi:hypothetical protein
MEPGLNCSREYGYKINVKARFEVFMAVKLWFVVFWVVTPCSLVGGYHPPTLM